VAKRINERSGEREQSGGGRSEKRKEINREKEEVVNKRDKFTFSRVLFRIQTPQKGSHQSKRESGESSWFNKH